jgi:DNA-binding NarL/FixJ family response regulator
MKEKQNDESNLQLKEQELSDRQLQILELIKKGKPIKKLLPNSIFLKIP